MSNITQLRLRPRFVAPEYSVVVKAVAAAAEKAGAEAVQSFFAGYRRADAVQEKMAA